MVAGSAGGDELAVGLDGERDGGVLAAEVGGDDPAAAEARVEAPVGVVADEREVAQGARDLGRKPGHDELAVGLDRDRFGLVGVAADVGPDDPAAAEARVFVGSDEVEQLPSAQTSISGSVPIHPRRSSRP